MLARLARGLGAGDILLAARRQCGARPERPRRSSSPSCRACSSALARSVSSAVTLPAALTRVGTGRIVGGRPGAADDMSAADAARAWRAAGRRPRATPYRRAGRFAWHFARGKLRWDPVFSHLIARGLIAPRARVLDIGCGQGLLASLVAAAAEAARAGPLAARTGREAPVDVALHRHRAARARRRARPRTRSATASTSSAPTCAPPPSPPADTVVLLDVLHYVERRRAGRGAGARARARCRSAAGSSCASATPRRGARFAASRGSTASSRCARGQGCGRTPAGRSPRGRRALRELGFAVASQPMRTGTPFANVLLVGTVVERAHAGSEP